MMKINKGPLESIRFWRGSMIKAFFDVDVHDPRKIEENGQSLMMILWKKNYLLYLMKKKESRNYKNI